MKNSLKLLKTMLKTSYDMDKIIDNDTKKLNKKSIKVWLTGLVSIIAIYLSYIIINTLKDIGAQEIFLEIFLLLLQFLVIFEAILLVINILYFSEDIENYLYLPISSMKLLFTKYSVMISIIFGSELILAIPSIFIYGIRTLQGFWFYPLTIVVIALITIFLSTIISIIMISLMKIFRFIKNKYLYRNIIIFIMSFIMLMPLSNIINIDNIETSKNDIYNQQNIDDETKAKEELKSINELIKKYNKSFIVTELGSKALSKVNHQSVIYILQILALDVLALSIFFIIGKFTYINDVLWNLSMLNKKKHTKVKLYKKCKVRNKKYSYLINEIKAIVKNSTYFMHYIYKVAVILFLIITLATSIVPMLIKGLIALEGEEILDKVTFGFSEFSLIIGIIQVIFIISSISLTAISRYGKNAKFFKYIPIKFKTQFRLKNTPQLIINTIIIVAVLGTIHYIIPAIENIYLLLMFIVAMLLNIINSDILLFLDLLRPSLNYENEITVIKQNNNKLFQYILVVTVCIILWYLKEVMKNQALNISILVEIIIFSAIVIGMEIFISKKNNKLFKKII